MDSNPAINNCRSTMPQILPLLIDLGMGYHVLALSTMVVVPVLRTISRIPTGLRSLLPRQYMGMQPHIAPSVDGVQARP